MELDALTAAPVSLLEGDVCIVGAGPAGLTLAAELEGAGRRVILLESGARPADAVADEFNAGELAGDPYADLRSVRSRGIGGTAGIWNTIIEEAVFGKYVPLDPVDFESRACSPWSGWPWAAATMEPWYRKARILAGLEPAERPFPRPGEAGPPPFDLDGSGLVNTLYQLGPAAQFTATLPARLAASPTIMLVRGATLTGLDWNADHDRITGARWAATATGEAGTVRAGTLVLAAGGIENPRLLLAAGLDHDWLGRGFMEHPVDHSLVLVSRHRALLGTPTFFSVRDGGAGTLVAGRIGLGAALLHNEGLLNASLRLLTPEPPALLRTGGLRRLARRLVPVQALRRGIGSMVRRMAAAGQGDAGHYPLRLDLEQAPHRENRVTLSSGRDRFGVPRAALAWRWRAEDQANREKVRAVVRRELERAGVGRVEVLRDGGLDPVAHHHAGTTRMHPDSSLGVVDSDCRVHGVENLYVAGSSVFPTAGVANPTLTILALAARLADHLARPA